MNAPNSAIGVLVWLAVFIVVVVVLFKVLALLA